MFCICMFCGCMTTTSTITSSQSATPSATQLTTQLTIPSLIQPTTQSFINVQPFINVQRKDNSEPLKMGTIVYYSNAQTIFSAKTIFRVGQVLNSISLNLDNDSTNTYYVSQIVLVHAYAYDKILDRFYLDNNKYMSACIIPSEGHVYSSEQSIVKGYYMYLGNFTYETVGKNPDGSSKCNTVRVFHEVDEPTIQMIFGEVP